MNVVRYTVHTAIVSFQALSFLAFQAQSSKLGVVAGIYGRCTYIHEVHAQAATLSLRSVTSVHGPRACLRACVPRTARTAGLNVYSV